ncbi:MAG: hypothetical protein US60_C0008G0024 [Microgenomates group bacterium GW2011_GWC1_37_8]|uniref:Aminotransferase class I/classII large domain-containing protein n=1 Tax=Candidatus Woesebacteria bacterium GW2011_GWB1_38_8 TaxID=1618570 RepID=A0A0G0LD68_9BACT|nr:MAG: hypothetical protein US60_C0008G0024 [Microgenomates group bacterium GW2011_GWC1_37_8]KKQ85860.1 MAG: hypothetical protein UT08_C0003G0023 [Candidatus Woesebacteria bacterium GW2011_GWB1_38_8]
MVERIQNGDRSVGYVTSRHEYDGRNGTLIDLGLGTSPIGPAPELRIPLRERDPFYDLSQYSEDPLHTDTRKLVIERLGLRGLEDECVVFDANGSYGAGDEVVRYLHLTGYNTLIVPNYSFPNVAQWTERHGVKYSTLDTEHLNPNSSLQTVLSLGASALEDTIVYVDYPNNPFGLADPILVRQIVDHVTQNEGIPIVDLAFGEVLGEEFGNAIQYTVDKGGICLASLSKTQGFPRARAGYAILPPKLTRNGYDGSQRMVFELAGESEFICQQLFSPDSNGGYLAKTHAQRVASYNVATNNQFYSGLCGLGLEVKPTDLRTPIQVVVSDLSNLNQRLIIEGVVTESLYDYRVTLGNGLHGYDHSAVRMLTPRPGELEEVLRRVELALK